MCIRLMIYSAVLRLPLYLTPHAFILVPCAVLVRPSECLRWQTGVNSVELQAIADLLLCRDPMKLALHGCYRGQLQSMYVSPGIL